VSRRTHLLLLGLVVAVGLVIVAVAALQGSLTYYRTPTDLVTTPPSTSESVRLGGLVTVGSVTHHGAVVRFVMTDGAHDVDVVTRGTPPSTFRGGQGAVVEGHVLAGGGFDATRVMVRHSNQYRPPAHARG